MSNVDVPSPPSRLAAISFTDDSAVEFMTAMTRLARVG